MLFEYVAVLLFAYFWIRVTDFLSQRLVFVELQRLLEKWLKKCLPLPHEPEDSVDNTVPNERTKPFNSVLNKTEKRVENNDDSRNSMYFDSCSYLNHELQLKDLYTTAEKLIFELQCPTPKRIYDPSRSSSRPVSMYDILCDMQTITIQHTPTSILTNWPRSINVQSDIDMEELLSDFVRKKSLGKKESFEADVKSDDDTILNTNLNNILCGQKYSQTELIGLKSGQVCVACCVLSLPSGCLISNISVTLSCSYPTKIRMRDRILISPLVECSTADHVTTKGEITLQMPTCYVAKFEYTPIHVQVKSKNEAKWQDVLATEHGRSRFIKVQLPHMGSFCCTLNVAELFNVRKYVTSVWFGKKNVSLQNTSLVWCICDDSPNLVAKLWLKMAPESVYKRISRSKTFCVGQGEHISLSFHNSEGISPNTYTLDTNTILDGVFWRKIEFSLIEMKEEAIHYLLHTDDKNEVLLQDSLSLDETNLEESFLNPTVAGSSTEFHHTELSKEEKNTEYDAFPKKKRTSTFLQAKKFLNIRKKVKKRSKTTL